MPEQQQQMYNVTVVTIPGNGARTVSVMPSTDGTAPTVGDLVSQENLHGRNIFVNGQGVSPDQFSSTALDSGLEIFATGTVKGN